MYIENIIQNGKGKVKSMKDFTTIKCLLEVLEEQANNIETQKKYTSDYYADEQVMKNNLYFDDEGNAHTKTVEGDTKDLSKYEVERLESAIKTYTARIKAYDILLDVLSSIDLNKVVRK